MGFIRKLACHYYFSVTGHFQNFYRLGSISNSYPSQFYIILRRNNNFCFGIDAEIMSSEFNMPLRKNNLVIFRGLQGWLMRIRPKLSAAYIFYITKYTL